MWRVVIVRAMGWAAWWRYERSAGGFLRLSVKLVMFDLLLWTAGRVIIKHVVVVTVKEVSVILHK